MVYDIFLFNNEFDVLDIRFNVLKDVVDKFVLIESGISHNGSSKPLYFAQEYERNEFVRDMNIKYIEVPIDECKNLNPVGHNIHIVEDYQREYGITEIRKIVKDNDVLIISDVDEIPNPDTVKDFIQNSNDDFVRFKTQMYKFKLNLYFQLWYNGFLFKQIHGSLKIGLNFSQIRHSNYHLSSVPTFDGRYGWHFSFLGSVADIRRRIIDGYDTQDLVKEYGTGKELDKYIEESIKMKRFLNQQPPFNLGIQSAIYEMPQYVQDNQEKFAHLLLKE